MKKICFLFLALALCLVLCACGAPCKAHEFADWEILHESSCSVAGVKSRACLNCDTVEEAEIPVIDHCFGEWVTVSEASCTQAGSQSRTCVNCNASEEAEISMTEHNFGEWSTIIPATCLDAGSQSRICSACETEDSTEIPATGHNYGEWEDISAADCVNAGQQRQLCTVCSQENISEKPALGHDFSPLYCTRCKESKYPLSSMYKFYDAADGLSVKINSFTKTEYPGYNLYHLNWTIKGITENSEITHGMFRLYLSDGTFEYMYGMFPYVYYQESYTFYYDWKLLKDKEVLFVEYVPFNDNSKTPREGAPRWVAP